MTRFDTEFAKIAPEEAGMTAKATAATTPPYQLDDVLPKALASRLADLRHNRNRRPLTADETRELADLLDEYERLDFEHQLALTAAALQRPIEEVRAETERAVRVVVEERLPQELEWSRAADRARQLSDSAETNSD